MAPDVVALLSHATQERLHGLLAKLSVMAAHRKAAMKVRQGCWSCGHGGLIFVWLSQEDLRHTTVSDVRSQLRFLEQVQTLKKKRKDEEERERLLRLARVKWTSSLPEINVEMRRVVVAAGAGLLQMSPDAESKPACVSDHRVAPTARIHSTSS